MAITLHCFLPTNGDSRSNLSLGNAVGAAGSRVNPYGADRAPDLDYLRLVAGAAERLGFTGALTPTRSWCEDAWVFTAALSQLTFTFLVAFRPGLQAPTLVAQAVATFGRVRPVRLSAPGRGVLVRRGRGADSGRAGPARDPRHLIHVRKTRQCRPMPPRR